MRKEILDRSAWRGGADGFGDWYRRAFDEAPIGMLIVGLDGRILRVNRALCGILGYDEDTLLATEVLSLTHEHDLERSVEADGQLLSGEIDQIDLIKRFVQRDGTVLWTSVHSSIVRTATGDPEYFLSQIQDITHRIEAQITLEQRGAILEAVAQAAHRFIASSDWEHEIEAVLARLGQVLGASRVILWEIHEEGDDWLAIRRAEQISSRASSASVARPECIRVVASGFGRMVQAFRRGDPVYLRQSEASDVERRGLDTLGILSAIGVPVFTGGDLWGSLEIHDCEHERAWSAPVVDALRAAADLLGGAIERQCVLTALRESEEELRHSRELMRDLARLAVAVREEERGRISRDIHDDLGQNLTALKMDLAYLHGSEEVRDEAVDRMNQILDDTIRRVREIASELRPPVLDDVGLSGAIEWAVAEFQKRSGIACFVRIEGAERLDESRSTALFRILQEALANVARHAGASRGSVFLTKYPNAITLEVQDDGKGVPEGVLVGRQSLGILGMRERAESCGGELDIESQPGQGTTVRVRLPVAEGA
ncbi:MAG: PAS domain S-box protein [Gemmatimonadota bacterium]